MKRVSAFFLLLCLIGLTLMNIPITKANPAIEDFTDIAWVENDPSNRLDIVGTNHIDFFSKRDSDDSYLVRDFGVDFFTDFTHQIDIRADSVSGIALSFTWALADVTKGWRDMLVGTDDAIGISLNGQNDYLRLVESDGGTQYFDNYVYSANTWYFLDVIKTGTNLTCNIYSDSLRTTLLDTLYLSLHSDYNFRYVYAVCNYGIGSPQNSFNIDVENLDLNIRPIRYVTFYNNSGGILRVDDTTITNGTQNSYFNGTTIELIALVEGNATYVFNNFTWDSNYNISNPSLLVIPSNLTMWCYFSVPEGGYGGFVFLFFGLVIGLIIGGLVVFGSKK